VKKCGKRNKESIDTAEFVQNKPKKQGGKNECPKDDSTKFCLAYRNTCACYSKNYSR
jgi:hypothetical protein